MREAALRDHLARLVDWEEAHVGFDKAIDGIPVDKRGARAPGFEHSPWQLVEHMRVAQQDILDFCVNTNYEHNLKWPDDYWPQPAPPSDAAWNESVRSFTQSREQMKALARDVEDLTARVPTGKGTPLNAPQRAEQRASGTPQSSRPPLCHDRALIDSMCRRIVSVESRDL